MKKKVDLAALAMIGLSAGMLVGCQQKDGRPNSNTSAAEQSTPDAQAFYDSLSDDAKAKFNALDSQHQKMAMEMLNQDGYGKNSCKGMGGCKNDKHACAGQNDCKGQGGAPITDPNKAVEAQFNNQTKQRNTLSGQTGPSDQAVPAGK